MLPSSGDYDILTPSISLLYHWSPFSQQFGHFQHFRRHHQGHPHHQGHHHHQGHPHHYEEHHEEDPGRGPQSLEHQVAGGVVPSTRHRSHSAEYRSSTGWRNPDYRVQGCRSQGSRQSQEIAREFRRLGIGFCFEGNSVYIRRNPHPQHPQTFWQN